MVRSALHVPIRDPGSEPERGPTRHLHMQVSEHIDDFAGYWRRALAGLVKEVEPRAGRFERKLIGIDELD